MPSASNWLGGMVGGLAGIGNALMMLRQLQQSDAQLQMKAQEGQGTFVPQAAPSSSFLQRLLSISPPGSLQLGNQSYGFQPHPELGEEGARSLGLGIPGTEGGAETVPSWASGLRMDPKSKLALLQQHMIGQRAEQKAEETRKRELEWLQMYMTGNFPGTTPAAETPVAAAPPGPLPGPTAAAPPAPAPVAPPAPAPVAMAPTATPVRPAAPAARPAAAPLPPGIPAGSTLLGTEQPPMGFEALPKPRQQEWLERQGQIATLQQQYEGELRKPGFSKGGISFQGGGKSAALKARIDGLQKQQDTLLSTAQKPTDMAAEMTATTGARMEMTEAQRARALGTGRAHLAAKNYQAAEDAYTAAGIPANERPQELQAWVAQQKAGNVDKLSPEFQEALAIQQDPKKTPPEKLIPTDAGRTRAPTAEEMSLLTERVDQRRIDRKMNELDARTRSHVKILEAKSGEVKAAGDAALAAFRKLAIDGDKEKGIPPIFMLPTPPDTPAGVVQGLRQKAVEGAKLRLKGAAGTKGLGIAVSTYKRMAIAHILTVTKGLTGTGRLAYAEVLRMLESIPEAGTWPDNREQAINAMNGIEGIYRAGWQKKALEDSSPFEVAFDVKTGRPSRVAVGEGGMKNAPAEEAAAVAPAGDQQMIDDFMKD